VIYELDDPRISKQVTREVKRLAVQLGYVPNITARSLRTGQSHTIGLVARDIRDEFSIETMRAVEEACAEHGYGLLLCNANDDPDKEQYYLRVLQQRRADGVLVLTPTCSTAAPYQWLEPTTPTVLIDMELEGSPLCAITVDHVLGGYLATKHLLDLGHRHIVFLSGPPHLSPCARMVKGYRQAMGEAGTPVDQQVVVVTQKTELTDGEAGMADVLQSYPQATALATISDWMAMGALSTARQRGLRVPADFSIVGYDDVLVARLMSPPLTTIAYDREALGSLAVELLLNEINKAKHTHRQVILSPSLVIRESTGSPPGDH
jgi:LacI family transcriptional regulator